MRPSSPTPLHRPVNTRTHHVRHGQGGEFRHGRHAKDDRGTADAQGRRDDEGAGAARSPMHGRHRHGRDYTPLFRFLLARVGSRWDDVLAEARPRLDRIEPVYWMVARSEADRQDVVRLGESSYFSGLYVDDDGLLQRVNPALRAADMVPSCHCCTHTFDGVRFGTPDGAAATGREDGEG